MGQILEARKEQVANDFMTTDGSPHMVGEIFDYESVYSTAARHIGRISLDGRLSLLGEIMEEGLEENPDISLFMSEDISVTEIVNNLLTSVLEVELLRTNPIVAAENTRRFEAFSEADNARYATRSA